MGLRAKFAKKFKRTTDSNHTLGLLPNVLQRQFQVDTPNQVWVPLCRVTISKRDGGRSVGERLCELGLF
jgi:transposase InsO family protein